jgi:hypothetical protein
MTIAGEFLALSSNDWTRHARSNRKVNTYEPFLTVCLCVLPLAEAGSAVMRASENDFNLISGFGNIALDVAVPIPDNVTQLSGGASLETQQWPPADFTNSNKWMPVLAPLVNPRLEVFVHGEDGHLWHLYQTSPNGDWSNWQDLSVHRPLGVRVQGLPAVGRAGSRAITAAPDQ